MEKKMKTLRSVLDLVYKSSVDSADQQIRVLHVDDESDFLKSTKQVLELQDKFQVETASSVKEAIQKMCEAYGWTIKETGKHSKGAQFTITMPKICKGEKTTYSADS